MMRWRVPLPRFSSQGIHRGFSNSPQPNAKVVIQDVIGEASTDAIMIEMAYELLSSLPRSYMANVHRQVTRLLKVDIIGVRRVLSV